MKFQALAALSVASLLACSSKPAAAPAPATPDAGAASAVVPLTTVRPARDLPLLDSAGRVIGEPGAVVLITAPLKGRVTEIPVRPGQRVRAGDPIVGLVMPELLQAAAMYTGAETKVTAWTARKKQLTTLQAEGLARTADLAEADARLADATAERQLALATLRTAGASPKDAEALLSGSGVTYLRAPKPGVVTEVGVHLGEFRDPAAAPLVRLESPAVIQVEAHLITAPSPTAIYQALVSGKQQPPVALKLTGNAPSVDPRDGTWTTWFAPADPAALVMGQPVVVRRVLAPGDAAVAVPAASLIREGNETRIALQVNGKTEFRPVEVIAASGSDAIVKGELQVGDQVAADATLLPGRSGS